MTTVEDWAEAEAAKLPPFTAEEAAQVGEIAARLDSLSAQVMNALSSRREERRAAA